MRRILSIDGGGIKGVFAASFLASLEDVLGENIGNYFDLIVGTSTGGILALGLGMGYSATQMVGFYEKSGSEVFAGRRLFRFLRQLGFSKYGQASLKTALENKFGAKKLGDSIKRLVIPSLNLETGEVYIYKTAHHARFERDYKQSVVDVALATAAAPTYFPTHRSSSGIPLIDGGVWANNPIGLATVEAIGVLGWSRDELKVLSVGCTVPPLGINLGRKWGLGIAYWALKSIDIFITAQSSSSLGTAQLLAGKDNVFRICPIVDGRKFSIDSVKEIPSLKGLGDFEARIHLPRLRPVFFGVPAEKFEPFHQLQVFQQAGMNH